MRRTSRHQDLSFAEYSAKPAPITLVQRHELPIRWLWRAVLLPLLMLLVILEPVVTFIFAALALLGLLTTLFFEIVGPPGFPGWTMLGLSLGFGIALVPYHALIRAVSNAYR